MCRIQHNRVAPRKTLQASGWLTTRTTKERAMAFIPVSPLETNDGDLVSLTTLRGKLRALPIQLDDPSDIQNTIVTGGASDISVSLATSLGVGTIFTGTAKASEFGYWL